MSHSQRPSRRSWSGAGRCRSPPTTRCLGGRSGASPDTPSPSTKPTKAPSLMSIAAAAERRSTLTARCRKDVFKEQLAAAESSCQSGGTSARPRATLGSGREPIATPGRRSLRATPGRRSWTAISFFEIRWGRANILPPNVCRAVHGGVVCGVWCVVCGVWSLVMGQGGVCVCRAVRGGVVCGV